MATSTSTTKVTKEKTTEGPSTTTKTTTYETISRDSEVNGGGPVYRPLLHPRATIINRTAYTPPGSIHHSRTIERSVNYGVLSHVPPNAYSNVSIAGCNNVRQSRVQEKKDMQDLNERLANYIEKVRFLEAQNRKLADELEKLKFKWGKETSAIKAMFQAELDEARKLLDEAEKEKARLEIRCASQDEIIEELRRKLEDYANRANQDREKLQRQDQQLAQNESELNFLRRRLEASDNEHAKDKREIIRLTELLNRTRVDLDNETLNHIDAENRRQTLEEEIEFLKQVHEQEMKELAALAYRDTTSENREYWKSELANALREIQITYDDKLDSMRTELETYYNVKIQEFRTGATRQNMETVHAKEESKRLRQQLTDLRSKMGDLEARNAMLEKEMELMRREYEEKEREWETENTELKDEVAKLRAEMEAILKELQDLMDTKLGLELEIAAYRKLLEGEESRVGLRQVVQNMITTKISQDGGIHEDDSALKVSQVVKGEMSAKTTYQRSAKGPVSIAECSSDGRYICLENTGRKEENVGGWRIKRTVDGADKVDFVLDRNLVLKPSSKVKIFVAGSKGASGAPQDIECSLQTWGVGANIQTKLVNPAGEDRATHTQKTTYTS